MTRPPRHGRACLLFACAVGAYMAWPRAAVPPLKESIPAIIRKASETQKQEPMDFLQSIETKSIAYCKSDQLAGRKEFLECMERFFRKPGLSIVVGGKSVGKTKIIEQLVSSFDDTSPVLYVDMRDPGPDDVMKRLEEEVVVQRPGWLGKAWPDILKALEDAVKPVARVNIPDEPPVGGTVASAIALLRSVGAVSPRETIKTLIDKTTSEGKVPVFIVDEANLALPNSGSKEAESFMSFAVRVSKQRSQAAVILVSSEYGYPYRLEAVGLNTQDAVNVIVAPEVERETMIQVLRDHWGMTQELAEAFEERFGGHLFLCQQALTKLINLFALGKDHLFDPYGLLDNADLPKLVKNDTTRKHMENIADKGWSPIDETSEEGAKEIAKKNYGAVIGRKAITFDIPEKDEEEMFEGGVKQVLIPPSKYMRACIQQDVEFQRAKEVREKEEFRWPWER